MAPHAQMEMEILEQQGTQVPLGRLGELLELARVAVEETVEMALLRRVRLTVDAVMEIQRL
jgi:biotin operon repressor